jgi:uncharacterized protein (DUF362 family)/NAD-dependent dihydropyrimidine dehydrogenase PreA subunit
MGSTVAVVKGKDYSPGVVEQATRQAINLLGGIERFIRPGSRVLLKPNLLMAKEPSAGITTHPEVIRAIAKILKTINCQLFIGDGPSVWGNQIENVDEVYQRTGVKEVAQEQGIQIVKFEKSRWRGNFPLTTWLDDCDCFISIPKFKTHDFTILTAAVKNLFGLVPGIHKTELHKKYSTKEGFARTLVDIYQQAKPVLTVVDGIVAMEGDGPASGGKLRDDVGLLLAGSDCVAIDSILALIMGIKPSDILTNKEAAQRELGTADIRSINILGERLEDVRVEPFKLPATSIIHRLPQPIINSVKGLIRFYPKIIQYNCDLCSACIRACPEKIINIKNKHIVIDYSRCIYCFCCQEACPNAAITIKRSLFAKLLGL